MRYELIPLLILYCCSANHTVTSLWYSLSSSFLLYDFCTASTLLTLLFDRICSFDRVATSNGLATSIGPVLPLQLVLPLLFGPVLGPLDCSCHCQSQSVTIRRCCSDYLIYICATGYFVFQSQIFNRIATCLFLRSVDWLTVRLYNNQPISTLSTCKMTSN